MDNHTFTTRVQALMSRMASSYIEVLLKGTQVSPHFCLIVVLLSNAFFLFTDDNENNILIFKEEIRILTQVGCHPHIIKILAKCTTQSE